MSLAWILSLLWARKLIVLTAALASLMGGMAVMLIAQPRYLATARVVLDFVKPDPITGQYLTSAQAETYIITQVQRVKDYQVIVPAVEALGWLDNPDMASGYASRPAGDPRPYQVWVADRVRATTSARMVPESNILSIEYRTSTPQDALLVVEALRQAYIEANVQELRQTSMAQADAIANRTAPIQAKLLELEAQKTAFSKATGVVLTESEKDPADLRLKRMAATADTVVMAAPSGPSETALDLARISAEVDAAQQTLGPNNPSLQALRRQRDLLEMKLKAERSSTSSADAFAAETRAQAERTEALKEMVLAQGQDVLQLRLLQDEINRYRNTLREQQRTIATLRQLGTSTSAGVTLMGEPVAEPTPVFPRPALILGGSGMLGLLLGSLLGLLAELVHRRVRNVRDLRLAADVPVLGEVPLHSRRALRKIKRKALQRRASPEAVPA